MKKVKPKEAIGEVVDNNDSSNNFKAEILAQINQYTDRPDLLLEVLEKHDPGFIKKMNELAKQRQDKYASAKYNFGRTQAYVTLAIQVIAAISILGGVLYSIYLGKGGFWNFIGLGVIYAISQGGASGFKKIIHSITSALSKSKNPSD